MESLSETTWDVILAGTGLPQSLLALALSRSDKKVLHIDKHDYYGGAEAALSLQEVETWADTAEHGDAGPFRYATVRNLEGQSTAKPGGAKQTKLGFSRAYSLSLSPQLIYTRSNLLPALVSSKVYRQLEFLAVGSWWLYSADGRGDPDKTDVKKVARAGSLRRIPGGREDVFADKTIDRRSSMSLMKFLKLAADPDAHILILEEWGSRPFPDFLALHSKISPQLQAPLLALTSSPNTPNKTYTSYALPRIHQHLTSIGMFGPGFGSVIPKWGGLAEIAQVACRAGAVGGGVYVLKEGFQTGAESDQQVLDEQRIADEKRQFHTMRLEGGEEVKTEWIIGSEWDLTSGAHKTSEDDDLSSYVTRSITIVSGSLSQLFPSTAEGAPASAGAMVVFPSGSIAFESGDQTSAVSDAELPPVYLMVHSSDTGECPTGQCVIYGQVSCLTSPSARLLLDTAVERLLASIHEDPPATTLWCMQYQQKDTPPRTLDDSRADLESHEHSRPHILKLPDLTPSLVLEDDVLKHVRAVYEKIMGDDSAAFMTFEDREGQGVEEEGGDEDAM